MSTCISGKLEWLVSVKNLSEGNEKVCLRASLVPFDDLLSHTVEIHTEMSLRHSKGNFLLVSAINVCTRT